MTTNDPVALTPGEVLTAAVQPGPPPEVLRRMFLARMPLPEDLTYSLPKGGTTLDYYPWAVVAEFMDWLFPGMWSFTIKGVHHVPIRILETNNGTDTIYEITVTCAISIDMGSLGGAALARENVGQHYTHEIRRDGTVVPNDKGVETAAHAGFRRACAMFGVGRHLYIRDESDRAVPRGHSIADFIGLRSGIASLAFDLQQELIYATREGKVDEDTAREILDVLFGVFTAPDQFTTDKVADPIEAASRKLRRLIKHLKGLGDATQEEPSTT